jgi:acyl-CoA synthetase (NDP forming)
LDLSFNPHSIAIVGASDDLNRIEGLPIKFLRWTKYPGKIFPVNCKHWEIAGLPCYLSLLSFIVPFSSSAAR